MPFYIPLLIPQIAFLFGLQIMLVWLSIEGVYVTLIWAHLLFVFPYVLLSLGPAWRRWDNRLDDVGAALGAGRIERLIRIKLPVLIMPIMTSLAVGFAVSAALYLPTIFVGGGRIATLTTEAVTLASGAGRQNLGAATALQMALPLVIFLCADTVSRRRLFRRGSARSHR
jgi:putative thiamine transport system permease protein